MRARLFCYNRSWWLSKYPSWNTEFRNAKLFTNTLKIKQIISKKKPVFLGRYLSENGKKTIFLASNKTILEILKWAVFSG